MRTASGWFKTEREGDLGEGADEKEEDHTPQEGREKSCDPEDTEESDEEEEDGPSKSEYGRTSGGDSPSAERTGDATTQATRGGRGD